MFIIITLYVQQLKRNHRKRKHSEEQNVVTSRKEEKKKHISYFKKVCQQLAVYSIQDIELENILEQNLKIYHSKR